MGGIVKEGALFSYSIQREARAYPPSEEFGLVLSKGEKPCTVLLLAGVVGAGHVLSLQVREERHVLLLSGVGAGHVLSLHVREERRVLLLAGVGAGHVLSLQVREEEYVLLLAGVGAGHVLSLQVMENVHVLYWTPSGMRTHLASTGERQCTPSGSVGIENVLMQLTNIGERSIPILRVLV